MDFFQHFFPEDEEPLNHFVTNGGFCGIFRKIACIGDSLSSGEFESFMDGQINWHDYYDYSWGQFIARDAGCQVYNFSRGGMTAQEYCASFAESKGFWNEEYRAQAYIIAMGVNDTSAILRGEMELGSVEDVDLSDWHNNKPTFAGYYSQIIQRYQQLQPKAKFFLVTIPKGRTEEGRSAIEDANAALLKEFTEIFDNCYLIDLRTYAPVYGEEFQSKFFLASHMNPMGYRLTALMMESYIDYIIRHNMDDFKQVGFVGTPFYNEKEKW